MRREQIRGGAGAVTTFESGDKLIVKSGATFQVDSGATMSIGDTLQAPGDIAVADGAIIVGDATGKGVAIVPTGDVTINDLGVTAIGAGKVTQAMDVANSRDGTIVKNVAESAIIGGIPVVFMIPIVAGALGDTDVITTHKIRVLDAHLILRGAGVSTTTLTVKNGANAITNAMAASGSDQALVRAASIDDAAYEIAAGGTLRVTSATGATQPDALVVVTAVRVA